ncbi:YraE protein [Bacillus licheniformis]|nr:YraE protein [Bacillus licheniformis]
MNNAIHETLELHELLMFKNLCLTKSSTMTGMVQDQELRDILERDASQTSIRSSIYKVYCQ